MVSVKMVLLKDKGFILVCLALPLCCWCQTVNDDCRRTLTSKDPHMSNYIGKTFNVSGKHPDGKSYMYKIGICVDPTSTEAGCAVVQSQANASGITLHCIGKVAKSQVARSADGAWIELTYPGGDNYGSHCQKNSRTARIVFLCDPNIPGMGNFDFLEENRDSEICYYLFSVASRAVCGYDLSVGDILLILFAGLVFVWLVAMVTGFLYKRFIVGAKGWEQVPLLSIYREFGNLEADGCNFVCRSRRKPVPEYKEPSFGADTDEEEEERDDNLLPM